jgi:hypothetical protein
MTVMKTNTRRLTIGTMLKRAAQLAGLCEATQDISEGLQTLGIDLLELTVDELQGHGVFARSVSFYALPLVVDQYVYTAPAGALDFTGDGKYIAPGQTLDRPDGETLVAKMDRESWQNISSKGSKGRPTRYYVHRELDQPQVWFWPIPDEAGTVRLQEHRRLADCTDTSATVDLDTFWGTFLVHRIAALYAEAQSLPMDKIMRLEGKASDALRVAKNMAHQQEPNQVMLDHPTAWSR